MIEHNYFYEDTETGNLVSSSHAADTADGRLRELSAVEFDRNLRAKRATSERDRAAKAADAREERDMKRRVLATKLNIDVEDLALLAP